MKKGKKMPSIELDGHSEATFVLVDGKITRVEHPLNARQPSMPESPTFRGLDRD